MSDEPEYIPHVPDWLGSTWMDDVHGGYDEGGTNE